MVEDSFPVFPPPGEGLAPADAGQAPDDQGKVIPREAPEVEPDRAALITRWTSRIEAAKTHHEKAFEQMRADMTFARLGAEKQWVSEGKYVANIIQRHVNQKLASLYAKNPRAVFKRRQRLDFKIWDGDPNALQTAMQTLQLAEQAAAEAAAGGLDPSVVANDPSVQQAQALMADVQEGRDRRAMLDRVGKTLEILFHYALDEQQPRFKLSAKQLVRRTIVTGVGYVKLCYQRVLEKRPEISTEIADITAKLARLERLSADLADGEIHEGDAEVEELRITLETLQSQEEAIAHEGLVYDFPRATEVIIDPRCRQINGFVGAEWIVTEMLMHPDKIKEIYKIDVGKKFKEHKETRANPVRTEAGEKPGDTRGLAVVWEVQDKAGGVYFTIVDGYPDFVKAPEAPDIALERFFNIYTLTFNDIEDEEEIYPQSDVRIIRDMQEEYNRSRQSLREHRKAALPGWIASAGALEDEDATLLSKLTKVMGIAWLPGLQAGQKIGDIIQPKPTAQIDPALYETETFFNDTQRTVGVQEANLGSTSGATATEAGIVEGSRISSVASNVDDLDDLLTDLAGDSGQVLLAEMSPETATKIAGRGAVWPEMSGQEIADEILLTVRAGSSGRPNKAQELANLERAAPTLLQIPGVNPAWFARVVLERLEETIDVEEAVTFGLPSIVAQNSLSGRQAQAATGDPDSDPDQQGGRGGEVQIPKSERDEPGGQPAFPTGVPGV